ncbi:MAG TPA: NADH-quinone oxidoreductase subunit NuoE [Bacteroidales bacterium]|jgi:NADH-quinone oxidoreductase subunit E|nr:NADH-quinone oxidoreductase subunit NuoE [Bacteroidales bacterium]
MLSNAEKDEIKKEIELYPYSQAACIDALKIVQEHRGWISDEAISDIASELKMSPEEVDSIATFYTRIYRRPTGRNVILICDSVSCMVMGYETLYKYISDKFSIGFGETTKDGRFTLLPISCLGDCDHAPAMMINDDLYHDITVSSLDEILKKYQ